MQLQPAQTLSHYRLVEQIGEGGMGVVWKAVDTTLDRDVAIKILPPAFANDIDRLTRFEREAKLLASLNHPNIATIHGFHEDQGIRFLAMEYLGGDDLSRIISSGPLPLDESLDVARQVAAALEEAHGNGVVHRDLKPGNVMYTESQQVKVLDFGLARRQESGADIGSSPDANTITKAGPTLTEPGHLVGTTQYMSPEQVRGRAVDQQTDIWAFGCVLYQMLTGKRAFTGETVSDCIAVILRVDPDYEQLPSDTPQSLRRILSRCLEKDPRRRWRNIGDVRLALDDVADEAESQSSEELAIAGQAGSFLVRLAPWMIAMAAMGLAFLMWWQSSSVPSAPDRSLMRTTIEPAPGVSLSSRYATVGVPSPDGTKLVYTGEADGRQQLFFRSLDDLAARPLPGTAGGWQPFFSPNGQWVGFFADRKLKKVPVAGGTAETIVEIGNNPRGGSWGEDGWIVLSPTQTSGLLRVHADDGTTEALTELDFALGESTHRWPQVLPGANGVLYTARMEGTNFDRANLVIDPLDGNDPVIVIERGAHGRYVSSGHIVFVRGGALYAVPFDLQQLRTIGEPVRMIDGVTYSPRNGGAQFAVSDSGTLIYRPGSTMTLESTPVWIDPSGEVDAINSSQRIFSQPRLSPDGDRLLVSIFDGRASRLWALDLARGTFSQITHRESVDGRWVGPDGEFVVYSAEADRTLSLFLRTADGLGEPRLLLNSPHRQIPCTVSPDGKYVVFQERNPESGWDLMVLELDSEGSPVGSPRKLLATPSNEEKAHFSRDGSFIAYESDEMDGVVQIYVRSFPDMQNKLQVSEHGARQPRFSPAQDELYFWSTGIQQFRGVHYVIESNVFTPDAPRQCLASKQFSVSGGGQGGVLADPSFSGFDVALDGERFLMLELAPAIAPLHEGDMVMVVNWFYELENPRVDR
ncbi:MAG: protein kinase domain-containing protein [Pirellulaceae bacterium]